MALPMPWESMPEACRTQSSAPSGASRAMNRSLKPWPGRWTSFGSPGPKVISPENPVTRDEPSGSAAIARPSFQDPSPSPPPRACFTQWSPVSESRL